MQGAERLALHHGDLVLARESPGEIRADETEGVEARVHGLDPREERIGDLEG